MVGDCRVKVLHGRSKRLRPHYLMDEVPWVKPRRFTVKMMSAASSRAEMAARVMKRKRPESRR